MNSAQKKRFEEIRQRDVTAFTVPGAQPVGHLTQDRRLLLGMVDRLQGKLSTAVERMAKHAATGNKKMRQLNAEIDYLKEELEYLGRQRPDAISIIYESAALKAVVDALAEAESRTAAAESKFRFIRDNWARDVAVISRDMDSGYTRKELPEQAKAASYTGYFILRNWGYTHDDVAALRAGKKVPKP